MHVPRDIFRQYDIRGVVGEQLSDELAFAIGRALATRAHAELGTETRIAVGRDNRPSGASLARNVADGIAATGSVAVDLGPLPTPALYFATHDLDVQAGVQITGSHNPPEYNGFKMVLGGRAVYGDAIQELRHAIEHDAFVTGEGSVETNITVLDRYVDAIVERHQPLARTFRVVVDCGNGIASIAAGRVLEALGLNVVSLYCESDGTFPNHHPDPSVLDNLVDLQAEVRRTGAELGIAFDGDGDRIGVVDEEGRVVFGDMLLLLFARDLLHRMGTGHPIIFDVKC